MLQGVYSAGAGVGETHVSSEDKKIDGLDTCVYMYLCTHVCMYLCKMHIGPLPWLNKKSLPIHVLHCSILYRTVSYRSRVYHCMYVFIYLCKTWFGLFQWSG